MPPALLISACLLGRPVRWNGGHKLLSCLADTYAAHMTKIEFCPETRAGLGTPRTPVRLWIDATQKMFARRATGECRNTDDVDANEPDKDEAEITARLDAACRAAAEEALAQGVCGAVVKSRSPSCALHDALVFSPVGPSVRGPGIFVRHLRKFSPRLPLIDDSGIKDAQLAKAFFDAVAAYSAK